MVFTYLVLVLVIKTANAQNQFNFSDKLISSAFISLPNVDTIRLENPDFIFIYIEPPFICNECIQQMLKTFDFQVIIRTNEVNGSWRSWWNDISKQYPQRQIYFTTSQLLKARPTPIILYSRQNSDLIYTYDQLFNKSKKPNKKIIQEVKQLSKNLL